MYIFTQKSSIGAIVASYKYQYRQHRTILRVHGRLTSEICDKVASFASVLQTSL